MPKLDNLAVVVAYDVSDEERRANIRSYLKDILAANQRTESVYEFVYDTDYQPDFPTIIEKLKSEIRPHLDDRLYIWDMNKGQLRRFDVHRMK